MAINRIIEDGKFNTFRNGEVSAIHRPVAAVLRIVMGATEKVIGDDLVGVQSTCHRPFAGFVLHTTGRPGCPKVELSLEHQTGQVTQQILTQKRIALQKGTARVRMVESRDLHPGILHIEPVYRFVRGQVVGATVVRLQIHLIHYMASGVVEGT